jgi:hypothetical protein
MAAAAVALQVERTQAVEAAVPRTFALAALHWQTALRWPQAAAAWAVETQMPMQVTRDAIPVETATVRLAKAVAVRRRIQVAVADRPGSAQETTEAAEVWATAEQAQRIRVTMSGPVAVAAVVTTVAAVADRIASHPAPSAAEAAAAVQA